MYKNTCCLITGLSETGSRNPVLFLSHNHVTWLALLKRNFEGAPFLENSPQTEGMGRILHKRRKWGEPSVFGGRNEYSTCGVTAELSAKGIPLEFCFWLTPQEEDMKRILHFWWKKWVLHLRSNSRALLKRNSSRNPFLVDSTRGRYEEDFPISEDKRSPPVKKDKGNVE